MKIAFLKIESLLRILMISLCVFAFQIAMIQEYVLNESSNNRSFIEVFPSWLVIVLSVISLLIGVCIKFSVSEFFSNSDDWKVTNSVDKTGNELIFLFGIFVLYYAAQLSALNLFFPDLQKATFNGIPSYRIICSLITIVICGIYRALLYTFPEEEELVK